MRDEKAARDVRRARLGSRPVDVLARILAIALNTFREAARDRVPLALFGSGLAIGVASLLVAAMSLGRDRAEVVAVLAGATLSLFALLGAIVLGASLLYKDLERKTIYPILARPIRRSEVIVGKHVGVVATLATFAFFQGALALSLTAMARAEGPTLGALGPWAVAAVVIVLVLVRSRDKSTPFLAIAPLVFVAVAIMVGPLGDLRRLVSSTVGLSIVESAIVAAISLVFGAFSSPFLTAACTVGIVLIGRNADLLAKLPVRTFGPEIVAAGRAVARVVPNLHLYVPPRAVLTGRAGGSLASYLGETTAYGLFYVVVLLVASALIFQRRDFA